MLLWSKIKNMTWNGYTLEAGWWLRGLRCWRPPAVTEHPYPATCLPESCLSNRFDNLNTKHRNGWAETQEASLEVAKTSTICWFGCFTSVKRPQMGAVDVEVAMLSRYLGDLVRISHLICMASIRSRDASFGVTRWLVFWILIMEVSRCCVSHHSGRRFASLRCQQCCPGLGIAENCWELHVQRCGPGGPRIDDANVEPAERQKQAPARHQRGTTSWHKTRRPARFLAPGFLPRFFSQVPGRLINFGRNIHFSTFPPVPPDPI
jgi:hypothetical protein